MPEETVVEQPKVDTPEAPNEGGGGEQLILGRFKTPDDLAKSYQELETKFTQTAQENAQFKKFQQENQIRQMFTPPVAQAPAPTQPENLNEKFWTNPVDVMSTQLEQLMDSRLAFVYDQNYEAQKAQYANDPVFKQYEAQIDQIVKVQYPDLRKQNGIVSQLYKMVKGLTFDEETFRRQTIEEYERSKAAGAINGIEGASPPSPTIRQTINLSDDEKRTAIQFYGTPGGKPEEAYSKYAAAKAKMKGVI